MSSKSTPMPDYSAPKLLQMTQRGCEVSRSAAELTARELAQAPQTYLVQMRAMEDELDSLDREINLGVTAIINKVSDKQTRELLACLKFIIELERIGDLLLSVANRSIAVAGKLAPQDTQELSSMAGIVAAMLRQIEDSFAKREVKNALHVLKADSELDRVRNLIFLRHIENHHDEQISESFHVVFIAQALERCGDHAKNMAEEICHLVSGCSVRHVIRQYEKPDEEVYIEQLRRMITQKH